MNLTDEIRALIALIKPGEMPGVPEVRAYLQTRSTNITTAGQNLTRPPWAVAAAGASDLFAELAESDDAIGIRMWPDSRGPGAYVEVMPRRGTLADVEAAVGTTKPSPRRSPAFESAFAMPIIEGFALTVWIEHVGGDVKVVRMLFDDPTKPVGN